MLEPQDGELQRGKPKGETTNKSEPPYLPKKRDPKQAKTTKQSSPKKHQTTRPLTEPKPITKPQKKEKTTRAQKHKNSAQPTPSWSSCPASDSLQVIL